MSIWTAPSGGGVMCLLQAGVPLSLLADLVVPPDSSEVLDLESPRAARP